VKPNAELGAEEKLAQERAILQYVVDNIPYLIFWKDRQSVYLGCNKNFAALDGKSDPRELIGKTDHDMVWKEHADQYRAFDREVMERGEPILNREEISPGKDGGQMVILTSKVPLRNDAGTVIGILGIIIDITERKQLEVDLKAAKEAAEQAARAKSEFITKISHELRTPLTLILGPVKEALQSAAHPPSTRQLLERVQRNGLRLYTLVNDVLDFAKAEAGRTPVRREAVDAVETVRAIVEEMQPLAHSRALSLQFSTSVESLRAALDPRLFERVVLNLLANALKFTPAGGWVRVSLSSGQGNLRVAVSDNGIGIPREAQARLFQRFSQIDNSATRQHEGTGLGLALVKQFTELMGGSVEVESAEGRGSTFSVLLPLRASLEDGSSLEAASQADAPELTLGSRGWQQQIAMSAGSAIAPTASDREGLIEDRPWVLVVDDNPDMRAYIAETLQAGFSVEVAENGRQAWQKLQLQRFDVVISDVMMPEVDGLTLTARIKGHPALAHVPVILVTARGGTEASASGLDAGADDYIAKPFAPEELRARARAAVRMRRLQEELRARSHQAGMASVATGVLHETGSALTSAIVSAGVLQETVQRSRVGTVQRLARVLAEHSSDLASYVSADEQGRRLPELVSQLAEELTREQRVMKEEIAQLQQKLAHLEGLVSLHSGLAAKEGIDELFAPSETVELALRLSMSSSAEYEGIELRRRLGEAPLLRGDKHKVLQILLSLMSNARHALYASERQDKVLTVAIERRGGSVCFIVADNGVGIAQDVKGQLFMQGFTTKEGGKGLGLYKSALLARELGGTLTCHSDGPGMGATFVLEVPVPAEDVAGASRPL
jgi:PAS domain S-box-containing protein